MLILTVIFPKANRTNLISSSFAERLAAAAGAVIGLPLLRRDYGVF
jgi:hypothetical protein